MTSWGDAPALQGSGIGVHAGVDVAVMPCSGGSCITYITCIARRSPCLAGVRAEGYLMKPTCKNHDRWQGAVSSTWWHQHHQSINTRGDRNIRMKTIEVRKHTRNMIETYRGDGETLNDCIGRLIKSTEPLPKMDRTKTNITIDEATFKDLVASKSYPTESHSDTLMRLLMQAMKWLYSLFMASISLFSFF